MKFNSCYFNLLWFVIFCARICRISSLTALVRPNDEECFFDDAKGGDQIHGTFSVTSGDHEIEVNIFDVEDKSVLKLDRTKDDSFAFIANLDGIYSICFKNLGNEMLTVDFSLHIGDDLLIKNVLSEEHFTPIESAMKNLQKGIRELNEQVGYHRNRLVRHHKTTISTSSRITYWSIIEGAILITVSVIQTFFIKHLFDKKRKV